MEIVEFLAARYDEWERALHANGHLADGWIDPPPRFGASHGHIGAPVRPTKDDIAADLAAKRAILVECSIVLEDKSPKRTRERMLAWTILRQLAVVHREHPDWIEAWQ